MKIKFRLKKIKIIKISREKIIKKIETFTYLNQNHLKEFNLFNLSISSYIIMKILPSNKTL